MTRATLNINGCSVRFLAGFNLGGPGINAPRSERMKYVYTGVGNSLRKVLHNGDYACYGEEGPEILIGHESNARNKNAAGHHKYHSQCGELFKRVVEESGIGRVHLSPWSSGKGGSTSQIRTVTWDIPNRTDLHRLIEKARDSKAPGDHWPSILDAYDKGAGW